MLLCGCQRRVTVQTNTVDRFEITLKVCATNNLVTRIFDVETNTGLCQLETQDVPLKCYRYNEIDLFIRTTSSTSRVPLFVIIAVGNILITERFLYPRDVNCEWQQLFWA